MATIVYEENGLIITEHEQPLWMKRLPSYGTWTRFLLDRGYARKDGTFPGDDGEPVDILRPLDHAVASVNERGHTVIPCICCGADIDQDDPFVKRHTGLVTVGGIIKVKKTDVTGPLTRTISWATRPVSKRGMGCKDCQGRMLKAIQDTEAVNAARLKQASLLSQIAVLEATIAYRQGADNKTIGKAYSKKLPQPLTPMIEVFEEAQGD